MDFVLGKKRLLSYLAPGSDSAPPACRNPKRPPPWGPFLAQMDFVLGKKLASGGFGTVYLAELVEPDTRERR